MFVQLEGIMSSVSGGGRFGSVQDVVVFIANLLVIIGVGVSVATLALGFIQMTTSTGDKDRTKTATNTVLWSSLGILICLLAWALKNILLKAGGITNVQ